MIKIYNWGLNNKTYYGRNLRIFRDKQECLSLASLSSLVQCQRVRPEPYLSEAPFRCSTLGQAPSLTNKDQARLERLAIDKHSRLLRKFINYGRNKFYDTGHWYSYYKTYVAVHSFNNAVLKATPTPTTTLAQYLRPRESNTQWSLQFQGWLRVLPLNIRLGQKCVATKNALAYCTSVSVTTVKCFIQPAQVAVNAKLKITNQLLFCLALSKGQHH